MWNVILGMFPLSFMFNAELDRLLGSCMELFTALCMESSIQLGCTVLLVWCGWLRVKLYQSYLRTGSRLYTLLCYEWAIMRLIITNEQLCDRLCLLPDQTLKPCYKDQWFSSEWESLQEHKQIAIGSDLKSWYLMTEGLSWLIGLMYRIHVINENHIIPSNIKLNYQLSRVVADDNLRSDNLRSVLHCIIIT